jgi:hypothetical protein
MDVAQIRAQLDRLYEDVTLLEEASLERRAEALDWLALLPERLRSQHSRPGLATLAQRGALLERRLREVDERYFRRLVTCIRSGAWTPESLRYEFARVAQYSPSKGDQARIGYDGLDVLVHGLLLTDPVPNETRARHPEMVRYEATPARVALDLVHRVDLGPADVFYDLGSGLGHIVLLVHLLTGVTAKGIEFEPAFCGYARRTAQRLGLGDVSFVCADARTADYADGTVFYLFTPFVGAMLEDVLERLRDEAVKRPIWVCTYGPCTLGIGGQSWLRSTDAGPEHELRLAVFSSV